MKLVVGVTYQCTTVVQNKSPFTVVITKTYHVSGPSEVLLLFKYTHFNKT